MTWKEYVDFFNASLGDVSLHRALDVEFSSNDVPEIPELFPVGKQADPAVANHFREIAQDGTGGLFCAWWKDEFADTKSPDLIVFFGSEGERGVIAKTLEDFLSLLCADISIYDWVTLKKIVPMTSIVTDSQEYEDYLKVQSSLKTICAPHLGASPQELLKSLESDTDSFTKWWEAFKA